MTGQPRKWVFLGDSIVEGVGSRRISFVSHLVESIRGDKTAFADIGEVGYIRLRMVDRDSFHRQVAYSFAGDHAISRSLGARDLLIFNLGAESTTIRDDLAWIPFLRMIEPERVLVLRGALESISRPACLFDGTWPWWVPREWRGLVSMDPRCYFSDTWWRSWKQRSVDWVKQRVRARLLVGKGARPLMGDEEVLGDYGALTKALQQIGSEVTLIGLLPVSEATFPGSQSRFDALNQRIRLLAEGLGAGFLELNTELHGRIGVSDLFYRDGLHPNDEGARVIASLIGDRLRTMGATRVRGKVECS